MAKVIVHSGMNLQVGGMTVPMKTYRRLPSPEPIDLPDDVAALAVNGNFAHYVKGRGQAPAAPVAPEPTPEPEAEAEPIKEAALVPARGNRRR